ncbi:hypothetical protein [Terrisporobacter sp.]
MLGSVDEVASNVLRQISSELQALITAVIDAVLALVGGARIDQLVEIILYDINAILDPILLIDCKSGYACGLIQNAEGTYLTGRKLIVGGILKQKIVYTAEVENQSMHSVHSVDF